MNTMKQFVLATLAILGVASTNMMAQDEPKASMQIDLLSNYLWRGSDLGGICVQSSAEINWMDATLKVMGSSPLRRDDPKEIDVTLGYKYDNFNFGLTDYWQSGLDYDGNDLYFSFNPRRSGHRLEANIGYTYHIFTFQAYTMIFGNDYKYKNMQELDARKGKRAFSTYIEAGANFFWAGIDWDARLGFTPFAGANTIKQVGEVNGYPLMKKEYFYADGPSIVRASARMTKHFKLGEIKCPVFAELHTNPYMKTANFMVGVSVIPF